MSDPRLIPALLLPVLLLSACAAQPPSSVPPGEARGALLVAPVVLADTAAYRGRPDGAAQAALTMEMVAEVLLRDPEWAPQATGAAQHAARLGRAEMRQAIGIAPDAPPATVIPALQRGLAALRAGDRAGAEAALGGPQAVARLSDLPRLPRVAEAGALAGAAPYERFQRLPDD